MIKALLAIAVVCLVIAILSPIVSYIYFSDRLSDVSESYENPIQEDEELREKTREFMKPYDPYLNKPYLTTKLGWYLHNSSDPYEESRNVLTIYGEITNIGAKTAYHCKLIINFYVGNSVIQTSEIYIGIIYHWSQRNVRNEVVGCQHADSVTRIEVERTWTDMP